MDRGGKCNILVTWNLEPGTWNLEGYASFSYMLLCFYLIMLLRPILYPLKDYACCRGMLICFIALVDAGVIFEIPEDR